MLAQDALLENQLITFERNRDVLVAYPQGRIDGLNARDFQEQIENEITVYTKAVLLDLSSLVYISSAGLRAVLLIGRQLRKQKATIAVCSLPPTVREVFEISGFDKIFPVYENQEAAISDKEGEYLA